jgi:CheY-like chemotaxis protein
MRQGFVSEAIIDRATMQNLTSFNYNLERNKRSKNLILTQMPYGRILVVDDVVTNLDVAKGILLPYGLTVDCASNGREAVKLVRAENPRYDLIFMDHMMPEMDGIETVRVIREEIGTDYARTVPIVALTANALTGNDNMFKAHGFQDFLSKPIDIMKMDVALNAWVRDAAREVAHRKANASGSADGGDGGDATDVTETAAARPQAAGEAPSGDAAAQAATGVTQAAADAAQAQTPKKALSERRIEGLDIADALRRFGGKESIYITILRSFVNSMPALLDRLDVCDADGLADYTITVHGIKGSCRNIGAKALGDEAEALEAAAKAGETDKIRAGTEPLVAGVRHLIANIGAALDAQ